MRVAAAAAAAAARRGKDESEAGEGGLEIKKKVKLELVSTCHHDFPIEKNRGDKKIKMSLCPYFCAAFPRTLSLSRPSPLRKRPRRPLRGAGGEGEWRTRRRRRRGPHG